MRYFGRVLSVAIVVSMAWISQCQALELPTKIAGPSPAVVKVGEKATFKWDGFEKYTPDVHPLHNLRYQWFLINSAGVNTFDDFEASFKHVGLEILDPTAAANSNSFTHTFMMEGPVLAGCELRWKEGIIAPVNRSRKFTFNLNVELGNQGDNGGQNEQNLAAAFSQVGGDMFLSYKVVKDGAPAESYEDQNITWKLETVRKVMAWDPGQVKLFYVGIIAGMLQNNDFTSSLGVLTSNSPNMPPAYVQEVAKQLGPGRLPSVGENFENAKTADQSLAAMPTVDPILAGVISNNLQAMDHGPVDGPKGSAEKGPKESDKMFLAPEMMKEADNPFNNPNFSSLSAAEQYAKKSSFFIKKMIGVGSGVSKIYDFSYKFTVLDPCGSEISPSSAFSVTDSLDKVKYSYLFSEPTEPYPNTISCEMKYKLDIYNFIKNPGFTDQVLKSESAYPKFREKPGKIPESVATEDEFTGLANGYSIDSSGDDIWVVISQPIKNMKTDEIVLKPYKWKEQTRILGGHMSVLKEIPANTLSGFSEEVVYDDTPPALRFISLLGSPLDDFKVTTGDYFLVLCEIIDNNPYKDIFNKEKKYGRPPLLYYQTVPALSDDLKNPPPPDDEIATLGTNPNTWAQKPLEMEIVPGNELPKLPDPQHMKTLSDSAFKDYAAKLGNGLVTRRKQWIKYQALVPAPSNFTGDKMLHWYVDVRDGAYRKAEDEKFGNHNIGDVSFFQHNEATYLSPSNVVSSKTANKTKHGTLSIRDNDRPNLELSVLKQSREGIVELTGYSAGEDYNIADFYHGLDPKTADPKYPPPSDTVLRRNFYKIEDSPSYEYYKNKYLSEDEKKLIESQEFRQAEELSRDFSDPSKADEIVNINENGFFEDTRYIFKVKAADNVEFSGLGGDGKPQPVSNHGIQSIKFSFKDPKAGVNISDETVISLPSLGAELITTVSSKWQLDSGKLPTFQYIFMDPSMGKSDDEYASLDITATDFSGLSRKLHLKMKILDITTDFKKVDTKISKEKVSLENK